MKNHHGEPTTAIAKRKNPLKSDSFSIFHSFALQFFIFVVVVVVLFFVSELYVSPQEMFINHGFLCCRLFPFVCFFSNFQHCISLPKLHMNIVCLAFFIHHTKLSFLVLLLFVCKTSQNGVSSGLFPRIFKCYRR